MPTTARFVLVFDFSSAISDEFERKSEGVRNGVKVRTVQSPEDLHTLLEKYLLHTVSFTHERRKMPCRRMHH
jgi:hypothetical protein